jgi:hypothetical protein
LLRLLLDLHLKVKHQIQGPMEYINNRTDLGIKRLEVMIGVPGLLLIP